MDIIQAAKQLRPGSSWVAHENNGEVILVQVEDGTPRVSIPTMNELLSVMQSDDYKDKRKAKYPSLGDQLDAYWKGGEYEITMRATIMAIKAEFPKP